MSNHEGEPFPDNKYRLDYIFTNQIWIRPASLLPEDICYLRGIARTEGTNCMRLHLEDLSGRLITAIGQFDIMYDHCPDVGDEILSVNADYIIPVFTITNSQNTSA